MINQLAVFLENDKGRLASLCRTLGDAGINMTTMMIADTSEYGIARIVCDTPEKARDILEEKGFRASVVEVAAVRIADEPGGLAQLMAGFDKKDINVEYAYCFATGDGRATVVIKVNPAENARAAVEAAGFSCIPPEELYKV